MTEEYELVPAMVERRVHVQEKLRCRCGETILTAPAPTKVFDKARFGPTLMAQVAVSKCADSLPLYRQAKANRRAGVHVTTRRWGISTRRVATLWLRSCPPLDPRNGSTLPALVLDLARGASEAGTVAVCGVANLSTEPDQAQKIYHVHYRALSPIIEQTCHDHGLRYRAEPTLRAALAANMRWLVRMGRPG